MFVPLVFTRASVLLSWTAGSYIQLGFGQPMNPISEQQTGLRRSVADSQDVAVDFTLGPFALRMLAHLI